MVIIPFHIRIFHHRWILLIIICNHLFKPHHDGTWPQARLSWSHQTCLFSQGLEGTQKPHSTAGWVHSPQMRHRSSSSQNSSLPTLTVHWLWGIFAEERGMWWHPTGICWMGSRVQQVLCGPKTSFLLHGMGHLHQSVEGSFIASHSSQLSSPHLHWSPL